jgi:hypothetical protein
MKRSRSIIGSINPSSLRQSASGQELQSGILRFAAT